MAKRHEKLFWGRYRLQQLGSFICTVGSGCLMSTAYIEIFVRPLPLWHRIISWGLAVMLPVVAYLLRKNCRFMMAHAAAHDGFMGILNAPFLSSARYMHIDQADAAIKELFKLYSLKDENPPQAQPSSGADARS